jgi:serine/threonine-protein kinase
MPRSDEPTTPAQLPAPLPSDPDGSGEHAAGGTTRILGGRYEILGLLGMGGMGAVYRAKDRELGEVVALKALRPDLTNGAEAHARFRSEVRLARRVTHRNVARTYDLGEADGHRFLTMELVEGRSLRELLEQRGALAIDRALGIALSICAGVAAAHEAAIIHRDLKPDNVVIGNDDRVVVMDFGIARTLDESADGARLIIGTPAYMAPEQAQGRDLDGRADQFAIGAILYEMLTGELPFPGDSLLSLAQRLQGPPPDPLLLRPEMGRELSHIVRKSMACDRDERFATVSALADALASAEQARGPVVARARSSLPPRVARDAPFVAVLPLDDSAAPEHEYVCLGITDGIIDALSTTEGVRVCPRGVTSRIFGSPPEVRERARLLGAQLLVSGAVRLRGDAIRVTVNLATVNDGFLIWRQRFVGAASDVGRFAEDAARGITGALGLTPPHVERSLTDPAAADLYLRGRREYFHYSPAANARACELLRLASFRAPDDAVILSGYAMAAVRQLEVQAEYAGPLETAHKAAKRAYQIAPDRVESLVAMGNVALHGMDLTAASELAARALAVAKGSPDVCTLAARLLLPAGALTEGTSYVDMALELEPRYGSIKYLAARSAALAGDWSDAERLLLRGPVDQVSPFVYWLDRVRMCYWLGNPSFIEGADMSNIQGLDATEQQLARDSARIIRERRLNPELKKLFELLLQSQGATPRMKILLWQLTVEVRSYLGLDDEAASPLLRAVEGGLYDLPWIRDCPALQRLRERPEVQEAIGVVEKRARAVRTALGIVGTDREDGA